MSSVSPNDRSRPVDIPIIRGRAHTRARSASESSEASTGMAITPPSHSPPRVKISTTPNVGIASSPVLSYFFPGSPTKAPTSLFGRTPGATATAVLEDDDDAPAILPASAHARRFSSSWAKPVPTAPPADDRGTGILRRLSLSTPFGRPVFSGTTGNSPPTMTPPALPKAAPPSPRAPPGHTRIRRSATIAAPVQSSSPRPPRAPSPMGERILKGHFDGFV